MLLLQGRAVGHDVTDAARSGLPNALTSFAGVVDVGRRLDGRAEAESRTCRPLIVQLA